VFLPNSLLSYCCLLFKQELAVQFARWVVDDFQISQEAAVLSWGRYAKSSCAGIRQELRSRARLKFWTAYGSSSAAS